MIAIIDTSEDKVVLIGEKIYRISTKEFNDIRNKLEAKGLLIINEGKTQSNNSFKKDEKKSADSNKRYIASNKGKSVIVNGLEPKLQFMGVDDVKDINDIIGIYKSVPEQVDKLLKSNVLVLLNENEKIERLDVTKNKKTIKGSKIKQSSSMEERMSESYGNSYEDSDIDPEDRLMRNAVKIDL